MTANILARRGVVGEMLDGPRRHLALCAELRAQILARQRAAGDAFELLGNELDRARLANALGEKEALHLALRDATGLAAAMTVRERVREGAIELTIPESGVIVFPGGETRASPSAWLDGVACAVVTRDLNSQALLANEAALESVAAAAREHNRPVGGEPFWLDYGRAFIALVHGRPDAAAHAQRARQQMSTGFTGALIREDLLETDEPVLDLIEIVASGARHEWPAAVQRAIARFDAHFSAEDNEDNLWGYLPLGILAVCCLAVERGFAMPADSPYLPQGILAGKAVRQGASLAVRYPLRSILSADEAHWFFDLQGHVRAHRSHRLVERNGMLVALYEIGASAGLPPASGEFLVLEGTSHVPPAPFALDAGELLFLAQTFSSQIAAEGRATAEERMLLSDAVACVDAAIARVPEGSDEVPAQALTSSAARAILGTEAGRFRRARLMAYRDGLQSVLDAKDAAPEQTTLEHTAPEQTTPASDSQAAQESAHLALIQGAQAAIDLIRAQAMPVLEAFAQDTDGTFVATLEPRDEDYDRVFAGAAVSRARSAYRAMWSQGLQRPHPRSTQTEIRCDVSPAGMLQWDNDLSRRFPSGYRAIAESLNPHCVWLAWRYVEPGQTAGVSFDGLVWLVDRWVWFPKPYRVLGPTAPA